MKVSFFYDWTAHDYMHLICVQMLYLQLVGTAVKVEVNELLWCRFGIFFWFISTKKLQVKSGFIHEWVMKLLNWEMWEVLPCIQHILMSCCCLAVINHNNKIPHRCRYGILAFRAILILGLNIVPNRPNPQIPTISQKVCWYVSGVSLWISGT